MCSPRSSRTSPAWWDDGLESRRRPAPSQPSAGLQLFVAPNFAIGAVLMMRLAAEAAQIPPGCRDRRAARRGEEGRPVGDGASNRRAPPGEPAIHSVRLPGLVAHQEVLLGGEGQLLTIRHDAFSREAYVPGVLLALERLRRFPPGLTLGSGYAFGSVSPVPVRPFSSSSPSRRSGGLRQLARTERSSSRECRKRGEAGRAGGLLLRDDRRLERDLRPPSASGRDHEKPRSDRESRLAGELQGPDAERELLCIWMANGSTAAACRSSLARRPERPRRLGSCSARS